MMTNELNKKGLGDIVSNSISIHCMCTGKNYNSSAVLDHRHRLEQEQNQLYSELDRREENYSKVGHKHFEYINPIDKH